MNTRLLGKIIILLEAIILVGITVHAPATVWLGTLFPSLDEVIKSWKEILMGICLVLVIIVVSVQSNWKELWRDWFVRIAAIYAGIHVALLGWMSQGFLAAGVGILIDLRYILYFILVYVTAKYIARSEARKWLLRAALLGGVIIIGFAALQVLILPDAILANIGYSRQTIAPFLTVDLNDAYVRINSTLRGPNPLGAYAGMALALTVAYVVQHRRTLSNKTKVGAGVFMIGSISALWVSYSRSAVVAGVLMAVLAATLSSFKKISRPVWIGSFIVIFGLIGGIIAARDTAFVSNIVLHENPAGGSAEKSNDGHIDSLHDGTNRMIRQPLGGGIGSTGSASLQSDAPLVIENQYLFIAHETGWAGLLAFLTLFGLIMKALWHRRKDWLALGMFASGVGLALIGLLLPVWVDDTVSIVWWGLAGLAIAAAKGTYGKKRTSY